MTEETLFQRHHCMIRYKKKKKIITKVKWVGWDNIAHPTINISLITAREIPSTYQGKSKCQELNSFALKSVLMY